METKDLIVDETRTLTLDELRAVSGGNPAKKMHDIAKKIGKKPFSNRPSTPRGGGCGVKANC
jgi:hypothetical protein